MPSREESEALKGQDDEEKRAQVAAAREAKKAAKAAKKAQGADRTGTERIGAPAATAAEPQAPAAAAAPTTSKVEESKKFQGQQSEEAKAEVAAAREAKKAAKAAKKAAGAVRTGTEVISGGAGTAATSSTVVAASKALQGQETEEQKALVKAQREAKKAAKKEKVKNLQTDMAPADARTSAATPPNAGNVKYTPPHSGNVTPSMGPSPNPTRRADPSSMFPATEEANAEGGLHQLRNNSFSAAVLEVITPDVTRSPKPKTQRSPGTGGAAAAGSTTTCCEPAKMLPPATTVPPAATTPAEPNLSEEEVHARCCNPLLNPTVPTPFYGDQKQIHYRVAELGVMFRTMKIVGSNARSVALIDAITELISTTPLLHHRHSLDSQESSKLIALLDTNMDFLASCRDFCVGMRYIVDRLKYTVMSQVSSSSATQSFPAAVGSPGLPTTASTASLSTMTNPGTPNESAQRAKPLLLHTEQRHDHSARHKILDFLQELRETIFSGLASIVKEAPSRITDGDSLLVYGRSSCIEMMLIEAFEKGKKFSVYVMDSAPLYEGRGFAKRLQRRGIPCTYSLLSSVCMIAPKCTKAFFGCSAVLQSGDVVSRAGTAMAALAAHNAHIPVLFFSELYKLTTSVWLLSLTINEDTRSVDDRRRTNNGLTQSSNVYSFGSFVPKSRDERCDDASAESSQHGAGSPTAQNPKPFFHFGNSPPPAGAPSSTTSAGAKAPLSGGRTPTFPLPTGRPETPNPRLAALTPPANSNVDPSDRCSSAAPAGQIADDGYLYDITPRKLINVLVTDMGLLHPTAIAAAVRERDEREGRSRK